MESNTTIILMFSVVSVATCGVQHSYFTSPSPVPDVCGPKQRWTNDNINVKILLEIVFFIFLKKLEDVT